MKFAKDVRRNQREELRVLLGKVGTKETNEEAVSDSKGPVLATYITAPMNLRALFKGRTLMARARRDGLIRFKGTVYRSPSLAAAARARDLPVTDGPSGNTREHPGIGYLLMNFEDR